MLGPKAINILEIRLEFDFVLGILSSCSSVQPCWLLLCNNVQTFLFASFWYQEAMYMGHQRRLQKLLDFLKTIALQVYLCTQRDLMRLPTYKKQNYCITYLEPCTVRVLLTPS